MRNLYLIITCVVLTFSAPSVSADQQARADAALQHASRVTIAYRQVNNSKKLFEADRIVEKAFRDLVYYYGVKSDLARDLALIRAKTASSRQDKSRVAEAWGLALELQPTDLTNDKRLALNLLAAEATAVVGEVNLSSQYFAAARSYAFANDRHAKILQLQLRIQELRSLGQQLPWRRLRDSLIDMQHFSEGFAMWTMPRLDALVSEAEIRLSYQPEIEAKRKSLAGLKSKIELMTKGMGNTIMPAQIDRVRELYYALEDRYQLASFEIKN